MVATIKSELSQSRVDRDNEAIENETARQNPMRTCRGVARGRFVTEYNRAEPRLLHPSIQRIQRRLYGIAEESTTAEVDRYEDLAAEEIDRGADGERRAQRSRRKRSAGGGAGIAWSWIAPIIVIVCGFAGIVVARRWRASLPIGAGAHYGTSLVGVSAPAFRAFKTNAPQGAPNRTFVAAPLPELFDSSPWDDTETFDPDPTPRRNTDDTFAAFPGAFEFAPESDTR